MKQIIADLNQINQQSILFQIAFNLFILSFITFIISYKAMTASQQTSQKGINILSKQLKRYCRNPSEKILPLIFFCTYFLTMPLFLQKVIPLSDSFTNDYLSIQNRDKAIFIICLILGNSLTVFTYAGIMYFIYTGKYSLFQQYRVNKNVQWPWQQDPQKWKVLFKKTIKCLLLNLFFYGPLSMTIFSSFTILNVKMNTQLAPSYSTMLWQIILFLYVQDLVATFTHTMLHTPQMYWIHKQHHQYNVSLSITAQYANPLQFIFSNSIPSVIGFSVLAAFYSVNIVTVVTWLVMRIILTTDVHTGYEWPWDMMKLLPFTAPAPYHDFHHSHNCGNYSSSFVIWDVLAGNNVQYYKYQSKLHKEE